MGCIMRPSACPQLLNALDPGIPVEGAGTGQVRIVPSHWSSRPLCPSQCHRCCPKPCCSKTEIPAPALVCCRDMVPQVMTVTLMSHLFFQHRCAGVSWDGWLAFCWMSVDVQMSGTEMPLNLGGVIYHSSAYCKHQLHVSEDSCFFTINAGNVGPLELRQVP